MVGSAGFGTQFGTQHLKEFLLVEFAEEEVYHFCCLSAALGGAADEVADEIESLFLDC